MTANLTPQYRKAEAVYRQATTPEEELKCLQEMLRELPKHKGTDKLQADLKQKISRVKKSVQSGTAGKKQGSTRIPRQGAGRVILLGGPNSGKSQFMCAVSRATPEVAVYPFTTRTPFPGMMPYEDVQIQLIDTPPVTQDVLETDVLGLIRGADLVLLLVDLGSDEGPELAQHVIDRLEQTKTRLGAQSYLDESDVGLAYTRTFSVLNKIDLPEAEDRLQILHEFFPWDFSEFEISAETGIGIDELKQAIYQALDVVRVYTREPGKKEPDYDRPYTIRRGGTLLDVAELIHKDLANTFKNAKVWGSQVHDGTVVKGDYVIHDRDIVEIHAS